MTVAMAGDLGEGGTLRTSSVSHHAGKLSSCISSGWDAACLVQVVL